MKAKTALRNFLAAIGCATLAISSASAQDGTWTQTGTDNPYNWSDIANWLDDDVANGIDATATFSNTPSGNQIINLDTAVTLGSLSITWGNRSLNIEGSEILTLASNSGIPSVSTTRPLTISSQISGSDGLQKDGNGVLLLNGTNDYTGGTVITAGRLNALNDAALGEASGSITLNGGDLGANSQNNTNRNGGTDIIGARDVIVGTQGGGIAVSGNNEFTTTGNLSGTGTLTFINLGGGGGRSINFNSTDNDFTGGIVINSVSSTFQVNSLADSSNNIVFDSTGTQTFRYGAGAITDLTLNGRAIALNNSNGNIDNANSTHAITINTNLIATGGGNKTLALSATSGPTNVFAGVIANETDGGSGTVALNVSGGGTWELRGENTFTGDTTISAGTLTLADVSSMRFQIGDDGVNNSILGSGTINLDGELFFDLTSASTNGGNLWNIVDVDNLNESYGSTFSVNSSLGLFTGDSGIWSLEDNGTIWEFSESTGVLTVIPEPTTALLGGLGMLLLMRRRRD